ncbi:C6 transcription factor, putative [Metarhizium acridum CQMa 102]|uniref:C6 transcription factor, putative n=1 Tax=Metarhizium acridum (strain CQMa 102) TaxID=655827 RepID=E9DXU3_METAQ|nr:C6 transcription factor, putative [Metarhizium acridum CQMa 102]EFY91556.1 C6 transcription factor, putative [Metarhizium acridum CQMa 102]
MTVSADQDDAQQSLPRHKSLRTRTGCLNCRKRRRKCDEQRPSCGGCRKKKQHCLWGLKLSFRDENAQHLGRNHPSMRRFSRRGPMQYEILDVTSEVMRDYSLSLPPPRNFAHDEHGTHFNAGHAARENSLSPGYSGGARQTGISALNEVSTVESCVAIGAAPIGVSSTDPESPLLIDGTASPVSRRQTEIPVADLSNFRQRGQSAQPTRQSIHMRLDPMSITSIADCDYLDHNQRFTPNGTSFEDGVFHPGPAYHELRSVLRQQLIQESRPNLSTRPATPSTEVNGPDNDLCQDCNHGKPLSSVPGHLAVPLKTTQPILSKEEECRLWRNWFDKVAPWLDIFDMDRHFQHTLPALALSNDHLRCAILALSARHQELKKPAKPDRSLALYQEAVRLLLPDLASRSTAAVASCVILCVLETLGCSPTAWHWHLDACASLMEAVGINGFVGGVNQALFWCLARTDVCGALISPVPTLAVSNRASRSSIDDDVRIFQSTNFTGWANYAVHLTARVLTLLSPCPTTNRPDPTFRTRWLQLWKHMCDWQESRPAPFLPVMSMLSTTTNTTFPTVIFSSPAAMSGTQLYHTASVLMLQHQPTEVTPPKTHSVLWHARQICAISISNDHHGAWMNAVQPLWVAGRCIRHPAERKALLDVLERIEEETGCENKSRREDLGSFWRGLED